MKTLEQVFNVAKIFTASFADIHIKTIHNPQLYYSWAHAKDRCHNPKSQFYKNYGGRGITMCDYYKESFTNFYLDTAQQGYKNGLTIERINNNDGYTRTNIRWIPLAEQPKNRSTVRKNSEGEIWSAIALGNGIKTTTFCMRLKRGMSPEQAATLSLYKRTKLS